MEAYALDATAIQCWTSMQQNFGVNGCTLMSMMSENLLPSACEVDVTGVVTMYAMQLASGTPSALVDWNNNYGRDPNKCVLFHCGNWAKSFLPDIKIATAPILGTTLGEENTYGALSGRTPAGPLTFGRVTTDDTAGASAPTWAKAASPTTRLPPSAAGLWSRCRAAATHALHLQERLRAPRRHERVAHRRSAHRGTGNLPRLEGLPARGKVTVPASRCTSTACTGPAFSARGGRGGKDRSLTVAALKAHRSRDR